MDINQITSPNHDGTTTLHNATRYFSGLINNRYYDFQHLDSWRVIIQDGLIYPLDSNNIPIREGARPVADIEHLADLIKQDLLGYSAYNLKPRVIPWSKIIFECEERLKKEKTEAAFETGEGFYYNINDYQDRQIEDKTVHIIQSAADIQPSELPNSPKDLWKNVWREGDLCCLFADANVGKSALAVQIGCEIAMKKKVLFCDYELSDAIFYSRYMDENGNLFDFPKNFFRSVSVPETFLSANPQRIIIRDLEKVVKEGNFEVVIIDNISFLGKDCYRPSNLSSLIYNLKMLQKKYNLSILILAHTVKRDPKLPITHNDLQGACRLFNFVDSCFALAKTVHPVGHVYLKQLKARADRIQYGEDNVLLLKASKEEGYLHFDFIGNGVEDDLLKKDRISNLDELDYFILFLSENGMTQRQIADKLKISLSKVNRILKKSQDN